MDNALEVRAPSYPTMVTPAPDAVGEAESGGTDLLGIAWQSRWLILLCTLLGGACAWAYLQRVTPRFTSTSRVYVEQQIPQVLTGGLGMSGLSLKLNTQAELIRSTPVLVAAADDPALAELETFAGVDNRVALIRGALEVIVGQHDDIINVSIELPSPTDAAQIVNAVVSAYTTKYAERRSTDVAEVLRLLHGEKRRRDQELDERRVALNQFRQDHVALAVQTSGEENVVTQLFSALSSELNEAQITLLEAKARYGRARAMAEQPAQLPFLLELARSGDRSHKITDLEGQIQSIEQDLVSQRSRWGEGYPAVKLLRETLDELRERHKKQQTAVMNAYLDTLRQNYELEVQRRDEIQRAYDAQFRLATEVSGQVAELASLQEAYDRTAKLCDILDDRIEDLNLSESVGAMNIDVIEVAAPGYKTFPDKTKSLSIGLAFGAMVGFGLAWLRDFLDHRLKSIEEIASALQLPIVGALPVLAGSRSEGRSEGGRMVALQPRSVAAEAVRTLRTSLHLGIAGPDSRLFVVTSPAPGDGKSTVASNLAIAMSQADQRVLLIDADMRKPTQHEIFGVNTEIGFSSVLAGSVSAGEAAVPSGIPSLDLLPCGKRPASPVELLNTGLFGEALDQLLQDYDRIIIDSPPVMAVADSRLIAASVDCTLLVLRAERSTRRVSIAARDELLKVRAPRLGVVVNAAPSHRGGYSYGYGGGYGAYGQLAYGYGEEDPDTRSEKSPSKRSKRMAGDVAG